MTTLEKKLRASGRRLGLSDATILVAVSGGADSTALLDALVRLQRKLSCNIFAAHLNHLLRGDESEADEAAVCDLAARLGVALKVERIAVDKCARAEKHNLEATARRLRYDFLQRAAQSCLANVVVTAHTRDDQLETILMRLLRGSGADGLRGIHSVVNLGMGVRLVRPLLTVTKAEVLAHCEHYNLSFRTDSSNLSLAFTRNRVRHELLPLLRTFNPLFDAALLRAAEQIADDGDYLNHIAAEMFAIAVDGGSLDMTTLQVAPPALRRRVLRMWLRAVRGDLRRIEAVHLAALEALVISGRGGSYIELPGGWQVRRQKKRLMMTKVDATTALQICNPEPEVNV